MSCAREGARDAAHDDGREAGELEDVHRLAAVQVTCRILRGSPVSLSPRGRGWGRGRSLTISTLGDDRQLPLCQRGAASHFIRPASAANLAGRVGEAIRGGPSSEAVALISW